MNEDSFDKLIEIVKEECEVRGMKGAFVSESRRQRFFRMLDMTTGDTFKIISRNPDEESYTTVEISGDRELAADIFLAMTIRNFNSKASGGKEFGWELTYHRECPVLHKNEQGCSD